jgi:hypothetical protein
MEKEQVKSEVLSPYLERIFGADKAEVAPQLGDESAEIPHQTRVQISFSVRV